MAAELLANKGGTWSSESTYELVLPVLHAKLKSANQEHQLAHGTSSSRARSCIINHWAYDF